MPTVQQATERTNRRIERANNRRMADAGVGDVKLPTFNMDTLGLNQKPAQVPAPVPTTGYAGLQGAVESSQDAFIRDLEARAKSTEQQFQITSDALLNSLLNSQGEATLTDTAYRQSVDPLEAELKDINQKILEEQTGLRRRVEKLDKNESGMLSTGLDIERNRLQNESISKQADLAVIQLARQGRYDSAKAIADRAVAAKLEQQTQRNNILEFVYTQNKDLFTTAGQRRFESLQADRNRKLDQEAKKEMLKYEQIIKQSDPLYQAQLRKANQEADALVNSGSADVGVLVANGADPKAANNAVLSSLLKKPIGQGTRTQIANVLGVVNAAEELANNRLDGKFKGINPIRAVLDVKIPFTNIGLPFRDQVKSSQELENEGYIDAINLKVQQWASGAALTEQQTEQVKRFTPKVTDTDAAARTKLNNLSNFMLTQAKSQLQSEGIDFQPAKVNLFETMDLLKDASPEQLAELRAQGLIQ